jgi:chondroitin 4-sulfotransferase 11
MFIDHLNNVAFIHIPKTAGSSIHIRYKDYKRLVGPSRADPLPDIHHMGVKEFRKTHPEGYRLFAFIRNPWDRLLSGFTEFQNTALRNGTPLSNLIQSSYMGPGGFFRFCEDLSKNKEVVLADVHFKPQITFLDEEADNYGVYFLGRYENLQEDWNEFAKSIGYPERLGYRHRQTNHAPYQEMYTSHTKDLVYQFYKQDIKTFGYKF